jgi:sigma-E factor negative regulatory protein RseB
LSLRALIRMVGFVAVLPAGAAMAEPADWLVRMSQAVRTQNYEGVLVYAQGDRMETMRIVHRYRNGREQERLQALSGDAREIHRDDDTITCILPKDRAVKVDRSSFRELLPDLNETTVEAIRAHYEIEDLGSTKLVGRSCRTVSVRPRDVYRYGYRIWIDEETAVPLKVELLGSEGRVLEQVMFTQIDYPAQIDDSALKPTVDASSYVWIRHRAQPSVAPAGAVNWAAGKLPPGFRMVLHEQQMMPDMLEPVEHMVFTDGLATVSAFMAPQGAARKLRGLSRMGAVTVYARMVDDHHVTVVGEVPRVTVEHIGGQLRYSQQAPATVSAPVPTPSQGN